MMGPAIAGTDDEINRCFPVVSELRPHLKPDSFVSLVRSMEVEGYRLAFIEEEGAVVAVAGYRIFTSLFMGRNLYVDDLVTADAARSKGYGKLMLHLRKSRAGDRPQCGLLQRFDRGLLHSSLANWFPVRKPREQYR
jgi:hypothetical protein